MHTMTYVTRMAAAAVALVLVLTGCSRGTLITLDLETLAFLESDDREGTIPVVNLETLELPGAGAALADVGLDGEIASSLRSLGVAIEGTLALQPGAPDATITVAIFLGSTTDLLYALDPLTFVDVALSGTTEQPFALSIVVDEDVAPSALALLRSGDAVIGLQLAVSTLDLSSAQAAEAVYTIEALDLTASVLASDLLPF